MLADGDLLLTPMREEHFGFLTRCEELDLVRLSADDPCRRSVDELRAAYESVSQSGLVFIMTLHDQPVGECRLQQATSPWFRQRYPTLDIRRVDFAIPRASVGEHLGYRALRMLLTVGFGSERADAICACQVGSTASSGRHRSLRELGFTILRTHSPGPGSPSTVDLAIARTAFGIPPDASGIPVVRKGDRVEIRKGAFNGLVGIVEQVDRQTRRVRVTVRAYGRELPVYLSGDDVGPAKESPGDS